MGIWDSFRLFSAKRGRQRGRSSNKPAGRKVKARKARDLRVEQFEARVLLNIDAAYAEDDLLWKQTLNSAIERASDLSQYDPATLADVDRWVVGLSQDASADALASALGAASLGPAGTLPGAHVLEFDEHWEAVVAKIKAATGVEYAYPLVPITLRLAAFTPNDPLYANQWHLWNAQTGAGTQGLNLPSTWDLRDANNVPIRGDGVQVGIVDGGIEIDHPDLKANYYSLHSWDFVDGGLPTPDPAVAAADNHGTAVAGVVAAKGNNGLGVTGVAPNAQFAALRIAGGQTWAIDEVTLANALYDPNPNAAQNRNQFIDIFNSSWSIDRPLMSLPTVLAALGSGATQGRPSPLDPNTKLGNIYVFAAGNNADDVFGTGATDVNLSVANSRFGIVVAAIGPDGKQAFYSQRGAPIFVSAYSASNYDTVGQTWTDGIYTTDRTGEKGYNVAGTADGDALADTDYTSQFGARLATTLATTTPQRPVPLDFGGTSAAAAEVSGVVALMLQANPNLTYRDVQYILAKSTVKNDPADFEWTQNAAGYWISPKYGFGVVDARKAVLNALGWETVGMQTSASRGASPGVVIGDYPQIQRQTVTFGNEVGQIEWVELNLNLSHPNAGDLEVTLSRPGGTSVVMVPQRAGTASTGYNWTFTTPNFWGEASQGDWVVTVRDLVSGGSTGTWNAFSLTLFGQAPTPELVGIYTTTGDKPLDPNQILDVAPRELIIRFNEQQDIDPATLGTPSTLGGIVIVRAGPNQTFWDPITNPNDADDVIIYPGYIGLVDAEVPNKIHNQVIVRFSETLPDDLYQVLFVGQDGYRLPAANFGQLSQDVLLPALRNTQAGLPFHGGRNLTQHFELDLAPQVIAVVPQPVDRAGYVQLTATAKLPATTDRLTVTNGTGASAVTRDLQFNNGFFSLTPSAPVGGQYYGTFNDGDLLTISGFDSTTGAQITRVFEFDMNDSWDPARVRIDLLHPVTRQPLVLSDLLTVITSTIDGEAFGVKAESTYTPGSPPTAQIRLNGYTGTPAFTRVGVQGPAMVAQSNLGVPAGRIAVLFQSTYDATQVATKLFDAMNENRAALADLMLVQVGATLQITKSNSLLIDTSKIGLAVPGDVTSGALVLRDGPITAQRRNEIEVYFSNYDELYGKGNPTDPRSVENSDLYQLIFTNDTASNLDDVVYNPATVTYTYDPATGISKATLTFTAPGNDLANLPAGAGRYRLRIGNQWIPMQQLAAPGIPGTFYDTFDSAVAIDANFGTGSAGLYPGGQYVVLGASITGGPSYPLQWPGANHEPGHRWMASHESNVDPNYDSHQPGGDTGVGVSTVTYYFPMSMVGPNDGVIYQNVITEDGKQRIREIFELWARYLGVMVRESSTGGIPVFVGDPRAVGMPSTYSGGLGGPLLFLSNLVTYNYEFGGNFFTLAMHEAGHVMGLNHNYDLPPGASVMGGSSSTYTPGSAEGVWPGPGDIIHGQLIKRPDVNDVDMYRFTVQETGTVTLETIAQRLQEQGLGAASQLNTVISVFDSAKNLVARNDDYFGKDSYLSLHLEPGNYFVAVTSVGNTDFNPEISGTGLGGTTQGAYRLRLEFVPDRNDYIVDKDSGQFTLLDGDLDGRPGGAYNFWFNVQPTTNTIFVDKDSTAAAPDGTLAAPYRKISDALAAAQDINAPFDPFQGKRVFNGQEVVMRIVGNNFDNDDPAVAATLQDNMPYEIGYTAQAKPLDDGTSFEVPKAVTVMIDSGAVLKFGRDNNFNGQAAIDVGSADSSSLDLDRSRGALQVLGTPVDAVYFTSQRDQTLGRDTDPLDTSLLLQPGDWGGLIFRNNEDYNAKYGSGPYSPPTDPARVIREEDGIFLNYVNYADMRYGGGGVRDLTGQVSVIDPIHMREARPTVTFNTIRNSQHAAMSADPGSFLESQFQNNRLTTGADPLSYTAYYGRVGPLVRSNTLQNNSFNALFVQIRANQDLFDMPARFDDLDIVHVITENVVLAGVAGGFFGDASGVFRPRDQGRLAIDPGVVVKVNNAVFEVQWGAQLIAEGVKGYPVVITSLFDTQYGAGSTFDTNNDGGLTQPAPGNWAGIQFQPASQGSIDRARIYYAGGVAQIPGVGGVPAQYDPIEIRQADVRVTNTLFQYNSAGSAGDRIGRGSITPATIHVRGAQPVIAGNTFRMNTGPIVSINANSLDDKVVADWGRTTGASPDVVGGASPIDLFSRYPDNRGPLVRENLMDRNGTNAMQVRPELLLVGGVWDDTDIVHVLQGEIMIPNFHTYGGLRLQSSPTESLVVKLFGASAGITASGRPLEIEDRIGGILHVLGTPGHPVVFTSLRDDSVGAGFDPEGNPMVDTSNDGSATSAAPGDWRSLKIEKYSHDRNVAAIGEREPAAGTEIDWNPNTGSPQYLGALANAKDERSPYLQPVGTWADTQKNGDETYRLGFEVYGSIRADAPADTDVYSFTATAGSEVWIDIDKTSFALDTVLELIDYNGNVLAWSDDYLTAAGALAEPSEPSELVPDRGLARQMARDDWANTGSATTNYDFDYYTTNRRDAGFRVILPGPAGQEQVYYVRVRAKVALLGALKGKEIPDHSTFTLTNLIANVPVTRVFEFVDTGVVGNGQQVPGSVVILYDRANATAVDIARAVRDAINSQTGSLGVTASTADLEDTVADTAQVRLSTASANQLLRFTAGNSKLQQLNPTGEYQLQIRLRELQETPGSVIDGAFIAYAATGIEVYGQPMHSPLVGETGEAGVSNNSPATALYVGNLLTTDREAISFSGTMGSSTVDWYQMDIDLGPGGASIQRAFGWGIEWPIAIDVDYADGLGLRPDLSVWVFDNQGRLILIGRDSNVVDDRSRPSVGEDMADLTRGSIGAKDPYIGPVYLPERYEATNRNPISYTIAVTNQNLVPSVLLNDPLLRLEPVNSLQRIAEDRVGSQNGSNIAEDAKYTLFQGTEAQQLNLQAVPYMLGDVVMFVNTGSDLFTVDPYTGQQETDLTWTGFLAGYSSRQYNDIAVSNDGRLYSITGRGPGNDARFAWHDAGNGAVSPSPYFQTGNLIRTFRRDSQSNTTLIQTTGVDFQAMALNPTTTTDRRYAYIVGSLPPGGDLTAAGYTLPRDNLLWVLNTNTGAMVNHPEAGGDRLASDIVPYARLLSAPTLSFPDASQSVGPYSQKARNWATPNINLSTPSDDLVDGQYFTITDSTSTTYAFEFDTGPDFRTDPTGAAMVRDGDYFDVFDGSTTFRYEFDSGPVLSVVNVGAIADNTTITVNGPSGSRTWNIDTDGNPTGP